MKNFKNFTPEKYATSDFHEVEEGIYRTKCPYHKNDEIYVTSLSFEMDPECYGEEEASPQNITQLPFENLLDKFLVYVTDFYDSLNEKSETLCYQEFGSSDLSNIQKLRTIIGKRFYAVPINQNKIDEDDIEEEEDNDLDYNYTNGNCTTAEIESDDYDDNEFDDDDDDAEYKIIIE